MRVFRYMFFALILGVCTSYGSEKMSLILGVDTRGTDSIYNSQYSNGIDVKEVKRYGYEGYIGGKMGLEYFFTPKNALIGFLGIGYGNIKLLNQLDSFDLYSGVGTQVGLEYLFNYYSSEKFDFGFVVGTSYFNGYYKRKSEHIISNEIFGILGVNTTINSKHRIELNFGIPMYSAGRYSNSTYKDLPLNRRFKNIYYGISYMYLFSL